MTESEQRALGRLEGTVVALTQQVSELNTKVDQVSATLAEAKGGWRVLLLVGGMAGTLGAFLSQIFQYLTPDK